MSRTPTNEKKGAIQISVADVVIEAMNQGVHHKRTSEPNLISPSPTLFMAPAALSGPGQTSIIDLVLLSPKSAPVKPHKLPGEVVSEQEPPRERHPSMITVRSSPPSASQESLALEEQVSDSTLSPKKETNPFSDIIRHSSSLMYDAFQSMLGTEKKSIGMLVNASATTFTAQAVPTSSNTGVKSL